MARCIFMSRILSSFYYPKTPTCPLHYPAIAHPLHSSSKFHPPGPRGSRPGGGLLRHSGRLLRGGVGLQGPHAGQPPRRMDACSAHNSCRLHSFGPSHPHSQIRPHAGAVSKFPSNATTNGGWQLLTPRGPERRDSQWASQVK